MAKEKIELSLQDESGQECVAYPFVESTDVSLSNGMDIETMIAQDVSLPTIVHSETSFKAGVGDSNISNSIVDSSVANMTIKGQTYQNILPDPTLRNSMTDGKTMQKLNEGYESVNTVDGVCKSAILSGQTLVNLDSKSTILAYCQNDSFTQTQDDNYVTVTVPKLSIDYSSSVIRHAMPYKFMSGKTYTVISDKECVPIDLIYNIEAGGWIKQPRSYKFTFVAPIDMDYINVYYVKWGSVGGSVTYKFPKNIVILEGDYTNVDIPYFEGMQSVEAPSVTTVGKNLWDDSIAIADGGTKINNTTYKFVNSNNIDYKRIKVEEVSDLIIDGKTYTLSCDIINEGTNIIDVTSGFGINSATWIKIGEVSQGETKRVTMTFVANSEKYGRRILIGSRTSLASYSITNLQIEEVTSVTAYESYKYSELKTKNLLQGVTLTQGCINENGSLETNSSSVHVPNSVFTEIIPVTPNTEYYIATEDDDITYDRIAYYSGSKTFMRRSDTMYSLKSKKLMIPSDTYYIRIAFYKGAGIAITPSQLGNVVCQEIVKLRSLPNGVCDTLNLQTGEYVQRIGEIVLDGSEGEMWFIDGVHSRFAVTTIVDRKDGHYMGYCDKLPFVSNMGLNDTKNPIGVLFTASQRHIRIRPVDNDNLTLEETKQWLQQNPITVQYELATPVTKTVDLSSSGNWEKIVLDGSESWSAFPNQVNGDIYLYQLWIDETGNVNNRVNVIIDNDNFTPLSADTAWFGNDKEGVSYGNANNNGVLQLRIKIASVEKLNEYLSNNPITVWIQKSNTQSYRTKEMLSFSNGHIQLSSNEENSLIPSIKYEVPTNNSYYLDLAKNNTKYTMKNMSETFTIDGTQYNASANGTFTTPSSMTDKLMVTSVAQNEAMIIEGDVTGKDMSYFKGIKSTFEGEDKIEVLSTGKNLIKKEEFKEYILKYHPQSTFYVEDGVEYCKTINHAFHNQPFMKGQFKKDTRYTMTLKAELKQEDRGFYLSFRYTDDTYSSAYTSSTNPTVLTVTSSKDKVVDYVYLSFGYGGDVVLDLDSFQLTETDSCVEYEPYKSNSTKIPLLSPLRSLPNGVCDEIILDRENHKAKIIQRVGKIILDGSEDEGWVHFYDGWSTDYVAFALPKSSYKNTLLQYNSSKINATCDKFPMFYTVYQHEKELLAINSHDAYHIQVKLTKGKVANIIQFKQWLANNNILIVGELATPIITEIDLEGFPYIYKDGHIFLNTDIAPTSEITYSINQQQQIEASNQDLIRQEKKITNLHKLIGTYVNVEYESTLLALNLELK